MRYLGPFAFITSAVAAITLAVHGFQQRDGSVLSTSFYLALQLFTFQGGDVDGIVPLSLEIARWLAPATTLGGIYAAAYTYFGHWWGRIRLALFIRDHIIVCGAGQKGIALVRDLIQGKPARPIVIIERHALPEREELQRAGVVILQGEAGTADLFKVSQLSRAAALVCLTGDDRTNIGIALAATACIPESRSSRPVEIHVHVGVVERRHILQRNQILDLQEDTRHSIRLFNCFVNLARRTWEIHPLEWAPVCGLCEEVHLVVGEMKAMEKAMIVQAGYIGHFRDGKRVTIHLISTRAKLDAAHLLKDYPGFQSCAKLEVIPIDTKEDFIDGVSAAATTIKSGSLFTVVLLSGNAQADLTEALILGERFRSLNLEVYLRVLLDAPARDTVRLMVEANAALRTWIHFLPEMDQACGMEAVFHESLDKVARLIHETWKKGTEEQIRDAESRGDATTAARHRSKETYREWEALTEEQKDVNRLAADHVSIKIRAMGLDPNHSKEVVTAWAQMDVATLDQLSRMEHERWAAPYRMAGWKLGERDDKKRTHPNLIEYDALDQPTKQYDADQVMKIPRYLKAFISSPELTH